MNLHEYQSKELFENYGLPVLPGILCYTPNEVEAAYDNLLSPVCVVKAQVHAGGRGKAGGVKLVKSANEAREVAEAMIGMKLVTPQTGEAGKLVRKVYVESGCQIDKEYYLSILVDRASKGVSIVASSEGGMDIEEVAEHSPEKLLNVKVDPRIGLQNYQVLSLGIKLGLDVKTAAKFAEIALTLYGVFMQNDLAMVEINPLVLTKEGEFVILDAKCAVDDNALFRHPELKALNDYDEMDSRDLQAGKFGLNYIGLDGNIASMVNGAGMAMATMDIIKHYGAKPANFLDVGGGASAKQVEEAFKILLSDPKVKAIFVNIFGGIMRCDVLASGIVEAAKILAIKVPVVVRMQGTNVEEGKKILAESGLKLISAESIDEAAKKVCELVK